MSNVVQIVKDRRYAQKPSEVRAKKKIMINRLRKKARSLKKMKNISPESLAKLHERINNT